MLWLLKVKDRYEVSPYRGARFKVPMLWATFHCDCCCEQVEEIIQDPPGGFFRSQHKCTTPKYQSTSLSACNGCGSLTKKSKLRLYDPPYSRKPMQVLCAQCHWVFKTLATCELGLRKLKAEMKIGYEPR